MVAGNECLLPPHGAPRATVRTMSQRTRILGRVAVVFLVLAGWQLLAGRIAWPQAWAFMILFLGFAGGLSWRLSRTDPDLLHERTRSDRLAEPWDRLVIRVYSVLLVGVLAVSALDAGRFHWSTVPWWAQALGWALTVTCGGLVWHVTFTNPYLARHARIQDDRGHRVVRTGLYAHIRHPMYLGIVLLFFGLPLLLGSWRAYVPSLGIVALFIYRTHREDRMLREGLPGYTEYARDVPYRLLPKVW